MGFGFLRLDHCRWDASSGLPRGLSITYPFDKILLHSFDHPLLQQLDKTESPITRVQSQRSGPSADGVWRPVPQDKVRAVLLWNILRLPCWLVLIVGRSPVNFELHGARSRAPVVGDVIGGVLVIPFKF